MNYEEAFFWWILGFGCGLLTMLGLMIWERSRQATRDVGELFDPRATQDYINDNQDTYWARNQSDGEPDAPGPPKVVAIPKRAAKKKTASKRAK